MRAAVAWGVLSFPNFCALAGVASGRSVANKIISTTVECVHPGEMDRVNISPLYLLIRDANRPLDFAATAVSLYN